MFKSSYILFSYILLLKSNCSLVADLWSKVVFQYTERFNSEFGYQWLFIMKTESCESREASSFVEQVDVV